MRFFGGKESFDEAPTNISGLYIKNANLSVSPLAQNLYNFKLKLLGWCYKTFCTKFSLHNIWDFFGGKESFDEAPTNISRPYIKNANLSVSPLAQNLYNFKFKLLGRCYKTFCS